MKFVGDTKMNIKFGPGCEFKTLEEAMMIREKPGVPRSEDCKFSDKPVTEEDIKFAEEVMAFISGGKDCPIMNTGENSSPELKEHFTKIDQAFEDLRSNSNTILTVEENLEEFDYDKLIQLTQASAKELRLKLYDDQNGICPLLGIKIPVEDSALDHKHKRKADPCGPNGDGLVRGMLSFRSNSLEGKITNAWRRQFGYDESKQPITLSNFLRNLANYLENPPCEQIYVHPSEKIKKPKIPLSKFNLIKKYWKEVYPNRKLPTFPKSGKITEDFKIWIEQFNKFDQDVKSGVIKKLGVRDRKKIEATITTLKITKKINIGTYIVGDVADLLVMSDITTAK